MKENALQQDTPQQEDVGRAATQKPKTMEVGTVISTAWRHYLSNFSRYLRPALVGTAWVFFPVGLLLAALLYLLKQGRLLNDFSGLTAMIIPAWIVLLLWCMAQSLGEFAGISRSVYQSLSAADGESLEPLATSLRFTRSRRFSLLGSAIVKEIILGAIVVVFAVILLAGATMVFFGLGVLPGSQPDLALFFSGGAVALVSVVVFAWLYVWLALKLLLNEQSLAIERDSGMLISIGRSWRLMRKNLMRSLWTVVLAVLMMLPITLSVVVLAQVGHPFLFAQAGIVVTERTAESMGLLPYITFCLVSSLFGFVGGIIVKPFFRTVLTTLYFSIKNQKQI